MLEPAKGVGVPALLMFALAGVARVIVLPAMFVTVEPINDAPTCRVAGTLTTVTLFVAVELLVTFTEPHG